MKIIKRLVCKIDEELKDAQNYAEMYVEKKALNENEWATKFRLMAEDELRHAMIMHDYSVQKIERLRQVYSPSEDMLDKWNKAHADYVDRVAWIKQMLAM